MQSVTQRKAANVLFIAAACNFSANNDTNPYYPASYPCDNIISVMATTNNDTRWSSSNYGATTVDLAAPGENIYACLLNGWGYASGTSAAAPFVAGACAMLLSVNPSLSYQQVKSIIMDTVDVKPGLENNPLLGRLCVTGGRLNIHNAILDERTSDVSQAHVWAFTGTPQERDPVAWIDVRGDLVLTGTFEAGSPCNRTNFRGLKVRNQVGTVVALLDANTGDMCVAGQCFENWTPQTPANSVFTVKASDGTVLAYIDNTGNLRLTGELFESI